MKQLRHDFSRSINHTCKPYNCHKYLFNSHVPPLHDLDRKITPPDSVGMQIIIYKYLYGREFEWHAAMV